MCDNDKFNDFQTESKVDIVVFADECVNGFPADMVDELTRKHSSNVKISISTTLFPQREARCKRMNCNG